MKHIKLLLKQVEGELSTAEKYHLKTRAIALDTKTPISKIPQLWKTIHFKTYPRFKAYKITQDIKKISSLAKIIKKRESQRAFSRIAVPYQDLACLLQYAGGIRNTFKNVDDSRRMYPSAGARYPLEIYSIVLNVENLPKGLYHYDIKENYLELLLEQDLKKSITKIFGDEKWLQDVAVIFIITGILNRNQIKYKERGYKFMLIETGYLAQNLSLLATELELGVCPLGGYIDEMLEDLLDIRFPKEFPLYAIAVGKI